jgi:hypothetical protein
MTRLGLDEDVFEQGMHPTDDRAAIYDFLDSFIAEAASTLSTVASRSLLVGSKLTGDLNVPAGEVLFIAPMGVHDHQRNMCVRVLKSQWKNGSLTIVNKDELSMSYELNDVGCSCPITHSPFVLTRLDRHSL